MDDASPPRFLGFRAVAAGLALVAVPAAIFLRHSGPPRDAAVLEETFEHAGKQLLPIAAEPPEGRAGQTIVFGLAALRTHQLYLRDRSDDQHWVHVDSEGSVETPAGQIAAVRKSAELLLLPSGTVLFADDAPVLTAAPPWEVFWVSEAGADAPPEARAIPRLTVRDDFAREELEAHPYARVTGGTVRLAQRGGGMPTTAEEEADPNFQRAVNPFSVHASDGGRLTYRVHSPDRWGNVHVEARFYFGVPKTGHVVDRGSPPADTDLLVAMGPESGPQAAFGWSGAESCFVLRTRSGDAPWTVLARWADGRPPLTNWVKIGLECRQGYRVDGLLDGLPVLSADLPVRLRGPFHIQGGHGLVEFDDVRAWSLPAPPDQSAPLLIRSRQFAGKRRKEKADSDEFDQWTSSSHAFREVKWRDGASRKPCAAIVTGAGILGDFVYEAPLEPPRGALRDVTYHIGLYPARPEGNVDIRSASPAAMVRARRDEGGWVIRRREGDFGGPGADQSVATLAVSRREGRGGRLCVRADDRWLPVSDPVPGAVHLAVIRTFGPESGRRFVLPPNPEDHTVRCTNLVHELFEEAPTAWNWVDGAFRMDCRWACQDQWNFMACGSTSLPYITGKRVFTGDQVHEAFLCLRATFPWDAGDATFEYDPAVDRAGKFRRLVAAKAWYNRRDLNLSFCSDGRDPLSGYSVVFGGEDNRVTRLVRRGVTVAESRQAQHLFPRDESFMVVHWPWWKLTARKTGARIRVSLDDELLFDYTDPEPIAGGHLGFWSVRNGFAMSRISSMAEEIGWEPHAFYVSGSTGHAWTPLVRDAVHLTADADTGLTRVRNTFGGGFFAVRWLPEQPVDLRRTPRLELPLRLEPEARVSLHMEIGGKPFIVRLGDSPLAGIKAFLVPGSERGECFQLRTLPEREVRANHCLAEPPDDGEQLQLDLLAALRRLSGDSVEPFLTCLTVGNSSNAGYLQAGCGGNSAGTTYSIGRPRFRK